MSGYRLEKGGRIKRSEYLAFTFRGKALSGYSGDTLGSALIANGVSVIGRSFKYHRPRGIMAAGLDEPNGIMQVGQASQSIPNLKAPGIELYDGLVANSVNAWPSVQFDILGGIALFKRFIPAGFYYKTFMWPTWHLFEPSIRKTAGLGKAPSQPDPDSYDQRFEHCDILIVGGGPAGLMAARTASRTGARVIIVETERDWGGALLTRPTEIEGMHSDKWIKQTVEELHGAPETIVLNRTMAFGYYDHNFIGLVQRLTDHLPLGERSGPRQRMWKIRAQRVILATGKIERPLVFPNNDRPGVMLAGSAETYASCYAAMPGHEAVIITNNSYAYDSALNLKSLGMSVNAIADARIAPPQTDLDRAREGGIDVLSGMTVTNVTGRKGITGAELHKLDAGHKAIKGSGVKLECDLVLTSGGFSPVVHLMSQSGGKLRFDETSQSFVPRLSVQAETTIGAAANETSLVQSLRTAMKVAGEAARYAGFKSKLPKMKSVKTEQSPVRPLWQVDVSDLNRANAKSWVDFQNDVTSADIKLAIRESFKSVEHVKRYTTTGMASDQGKTSNVNAIGVMESQLDKAMAQVGTTKFRPPYDPVTVGAYVGHYRGENFHPIRLLPSNEQVRNLGGVMEKYGGWSRPAYFTVKGESEVAAIRREVMATRNSLGLFDASPLGKIEVKGPDARTFLNRIYVNNIMTLKAGHCRYGLMLDENGIVFDDGILACIADDHFLVGTTSGHAEAVGLMLEEWLQCEWPDMDVVTENVTTCWAVINICGSKARDVLESFDSDIDFSGDAFKHMQLHVGRFSGVPTRIQRISFSGELSYEVAVPWGYGAALWDEFMQAGADHNITPFGLEALMVMRVEKGFLHVGSDTDGMTLPQDIGFGSIIAKKKDDFIGRRSTMRPDGLRPDRRQLVGLDPEGETPLAVGAHILPKDAKAPAATQGWVTSSVYSPSLNKPMAMALIESGLTRMGEEVQVWDLSRSRIAKIVRLGGVDPKGDKLNA